MTAQSNAPVIVKRRKNVIEGGHHGGAWKVAYADFVTAMMAFFMLMWLLGATTEKQRKGIADYFNPTIPVVRASGGGSGAFGGDSPFSENALPQNGTGAGLARPTEERQARGEIGTDIVRDDSPAETKAPGEPTLQEVERILRGVGGESMVTELLRRHVVTRLSDEGLVIELFDTGEATLFDDVNAPTPLLEELVAAIAPVLNLVSNDVAVASHTRSVPVVRRENPVWSLTSDRSQSARLLLAGDGVPEARLQRITGFADRKPVTRNPFDPRNDRLEIVLLRDRI